MQCTYILAQQTPAGAEQLANPRKKATCVQAGHKHTYHFNRLVHIPVLQLLGHLVLHCHIPGGQRVLSLHRNHHNLTAYTQISGLLPR